MYAGLCIMAEVAREIGDEGVEACAVGSSGGVRETRRTVVKTGTCSSAIVCYLEKLDVLSIPAQSVQR